MLFGCYRRGDANDPDAYVAAIAAVLSLYDADLIREVTDPRTGIMTSEKHAAFMPNVGELKVYCDTIAARRERMKKLGDLRGPSTRTAEAPDGSFAHVFVPQDHTRYASLVEWAGTAHRKYWKFGKSSDGRDGIWVAYGAWDGNQGFMREACRGA